ncbi:MAG: hypothetical protein MUO50_02230, partial [Longimicrobiales bacterium]|nr:hypothetical protein [Longimicrobiales bacterium]
MNLIKNAGLAIVAFLGILCLGRLEPTGAQLTEELTRAYLWPTSEDEFRVVSARIAQDEALVGVSRQQMHDLEEWM